MSRVRAGWRRWTLPSLSLALAARVLAGPLPLNYYDVGYALVWGREILRGQLPDYRTPGASTPHPLGTLLATLAAILGSPGAWYAVQASIFLALGLTGTALFHLTRTCLGRLAAEAGPPADRTPILSAAIAVGALLLSPPFLTDALGGSGLSDLPALAFILAAAALVADRPDRPAPPLVLLGFAGLMRPEAWGLAGAYWLYLAYRRLPARQLVRAAALVAAPPLLWALCDLVVVGDPAYSLTNTQAATRAGFFRHGLDQAPAAAARGLRALVGLPVLVVGALGAVGALGLDRRATAPALALLGLALGEFAALGIAGVPLLERFLLVLAALACLFFAYAVLGSRRQLLGRLPPAGGWLARGWVAGSILLVALVAAQHVRGDLHVRRDQAAAVRAEADLVSLAAQPAVRATLRRCPTVYVPRFTLISLVAYDFDLPPRSIQRTTRAAPGPGLVLTSRAAAAGAYFGVSAPRRPGLPRPTLSLAPPVAQNRSWRLDAGGCP